MNTNEKLKKLHHYIDMQFPSHLEKTREFLRIRSVDGERQGLLDAAKWVNEYVEAAGGRSKLIDGNEAPIVLGKFDSGKPKTLLVYGMYDVHPASDPDWVSPPFAAEIRALPEVGDFDLVIARGACNSKGPLAGFLNTLSAMRQLDKLPVNLILTIEGEEESGSMSLDSFYRENKELLQADAGFEPFWAEYGTDVNRPTLSLGSKGVVTLELICRGGEWGGPVSGPVHSSVGAWLASPTWRLVKALGTLVGDDEEIMIEGFHDDIVGPSEEDEQLLRDLVVDFDEPETLDTMGGARRFKYGLHGIDLLHKYLFSPSLSINLVPQSEGETIPPEARAKLTIRLVPDMDVDGTVRLVRQHLEKRGYEDIEVLKLDGYPWSRVSLKEGVVQSMIDAYHYHGCKPAIQPMLASATPYYLFSRVLGIPYTWGGLGRAGRSHSTNEFASVEGLRLFEKSVATFLYFFGCK
jgi:acetylornithine deacetylase/succinyl-diaminopimelate desuccinylase-like protein